MSTEDIPKPWLETLKPVRKTSLEYKDISTFQFVKMRAENYPNDISMIFPKGKSITYAQLLDMIKRMAVVFKDMGINKGDKIALMLPNTPHYVICHYAIMSIGGTVVQTNPLYTHRELTHIITDSGAKGIVSITMFQDKINDVLNNPENPLEWAIFGNIKDFLKPITAFLGTVLGKLKDHPKMKPLPKNHDFMTLMKSADPSRFQEDEVDFETGLVLLQYTGGTTGLSKGAMLSPKNISYNAQQARECIHMVPEREGSILTVLPLFHSFGLTACLGLSFQLGVPMVLVPKFAAADALSLIEKHKITFFPGVPTMMIALLNHEDATKRDLSSLIAVISGGAPLPVEVAKQFKEITGGDLVEGYGLSETSPLVCINPIGVPEVPPQIGSIGLPAPDTFVKIVDTEDASKNMPLGEVGEIAVKGPQVMAGYYNKPQVNKRTIIDGWFLTGDVAYMDEKGFTYIVDRKKDMVIVSGYNVYPREVEEVLFEHPSILEAAVAGMTHPVKGEIISAWVVLKEGKEATEEEIIKFCKERLAPYKAPKQVVFRDELPKSMIGKVLRRKLTEENNE